MYNGVAQKSNMPVCNQSPTLQRSVVHSSSGSGTPTRAAINQPTNQPTKQPTNQPTKTMQSSLWAQA
jgi:hypothetical protein